MGAATKEKEVAKEKKRRKAKTKTKTKRRTRRSGVCGECVILMGVLGVVGALTWDHWADRARALLPATLQHTLDTTLATCPYLSGGGNVGDVDLATGSNAHAGLIAVDENKEGHAASASSSAESPHSQSDGGDRYTEDELAVYDGSDPSKPVLVSISGYVMDVSEKGMEFYGPGGPYSAFAGRAATRGIALPSLEEVDISDDVSDFTEEQSGKVRDWTAFFLKKYTQVGWLVPDDPATADEKRRARAEKRQSVRQSEASGKRQQMLENMMKNAERTFTDAELARHNGEDPEKPLLLAFAGHVVDASASHYLYGPGKAFNVYAGRPSTRALTLRSTESEHLEAGDFVDDFDEAQRKEMARKAEFFLGKFNKVGTLASWAEKHGDPVDALLNSGGA